MNAHTLAARETVREIRESLSRMEPDKTTLLAEVGRCRAQLDDAYGYPEPMDYERIELWSGLLCTVAGMLQQRFK